MGGSSGGGGSSGKVSHSAYLETVHKDWLDKTGTDTIEKSMTEVMDSALGNSPWTGKTAYDPDADISAYEAVIAAFKTILSGISDTDDWETIYNKASSTITPVTEATIAADISAFANQLDDEITTKVLPRFRRGMQDINAVVSSAFVIGESVIEAFRDRDVAKFSSGLRIALEAKNSELMISGTDQMLRLMLQRLGLEETYMKVFVEGQRIKIVAKKEENDQNAKFDEEDALWDLGVFQYGANLLAGIQGGTTAPDTKKPSQWQSAIGGALTGATAGYNVGSSSGNGGWGAVIGGILGGASSFL